MTDNAAQVLELARRLSPREQLELIQTLAALARETLEVQTAPAQEVAPDPILELVGAYAHELRHSGQQGGAWPARRQQRKV